MASKKKNTDTAPKNEEVEAAPEIDSEKISALVEYLRMKEPSLRAKQAEVARIIFPFLIVNMVLFALLFAIRDIDKFAINENSSYFGFVTGIDRSYVITFLTLISFYLLMKFGYLFYQGIKDILSLEDIIDSSLPYNSNMEKSDKSYRENIYQICKSNYILQSVAVFLRKLNLNKEGIQITGSLFGSNPPRRIIIKFVMLLMIIAFVLYIAIAQSMILMVLMSFERKIAFLVFFAFAVYYVFFFLLIFHEHPDITRDNDTRSFYIDDVMYWLTIVVFTILMFGSTVSNFQILTEKEFFKENQLSTCRMTYNQMTSTAPFMITTSFLFETADGSDYTKISDTNPQTTINDPDQNEKDDSNDSSKSSHKYAPLCLDNN